MFVVTVIQEVRQPLVHTGIMMLSQMPSLGVLGVMLAEILTARTARCGTIPLGKRRESHGKHKHYNQ